MPDNATDITLFDIRNKLEKKTSNLELAVNDIEIPGLSDSQKIEQPVVTEVKNRYKNPGFSDFQNEFANLLLAKGKLQDIQDAVYQSYAVCIVILDDLKSQSKEIDYDGLNSMALMYKTVAEARKNSAGNTNDK